MAKVKSIRDIPIGGNGMDEWDRESLNEYRKAAARKSKIIRFGKTVFLYTAIVGQCIIFIHFAYKYW